MSKFMELVKEVVQSGISVTLEFDHTEGKIYADLNFNAKSHGYLYEQEDGSLVVKMRYDEVKLVEDFNDLLYCFKQALHGRDFGNPVWFDLCVKYGVLSKNVETKVTYS